MEGIFTVDISVSFWLESGEGFTITSRNPKASLENLEQYFSSSYVKEISYQAEATKRLADMNKEK